MTDNTMGAPRLDRAMVSRIAKMAGDPNKAHCARLKDLAHAIGFTDATTMMGVLKAAESFSNDDKVNKETPCYQEYKTPLERMIEMKEGIVNILELKLGRRIPTPEEQKIIVRLVTFICSFHMEIEATTTSLIFAVTSEAYKQYADSNKEQIYVNNVEPIVDAALTRIRTSVPDQTSWWEVSTILHVCEEIEGARIAQRRALPTLASLILVANSTEWISQVYGDVLCATNETILNAFTRSISEIIREATPPKFQQGKHVSAKLINTSDSNAVSQIDLRFLLNREPLETLIEKIISGETAWIRENADLFFKNNLGELSFWSEPQFDIVYDTRKAARWVLKYRSIDTLSLDLKRSFVALAFGSESASMQMS